MNEIRPWQELSREVIFSKYSRKIEKVMFELPDGSHSDYYVKAEGLAACIIGLTMDNQVILVRQYRPGPKAILNELPGGFVEPKEDPQEAARREFREETGYDGDFEYVGPSLDDAYSTMVRHCFVAKNCRRFGDPEQSAAEHTQVVLTSLEDFRDCLRRGQMTDVEMGYMALDHLNLL